MSDKERRLNVIAKYRSDMRRYVSDRWARYVRRITVNPETKIYTRHNTYDDLSEFVSLFNTEESYDRLVDAGFRVNFVETPRRYFPDLPSYEYNRRTQFIAVIRLRADDSEIFFIMEHHKIFRGSRHFYCGDYYRLHVYPSDTKIRTFVKMVLS